MIRDKICELCEEYLSYAKSRDLSDNILNIIKRKISYDLMTLGSVIDSFEENNKDDSLTSTNLELLKNLEETMTKL